MNKESINLNGFKEIQQLFSNKNKEITEEELFMLFENSLEEGETNANIDKFVQNIAENYDIDSIDELHQVISNIAQTDGDKENLSLEDFIYKEEGSNTNKQNTFNESELDDKWQSVEAQTDKALGFLWETGTYTYKTSKGVDITVSDTTDIKIYENKETGEVIVVGAKGAKINSSSDDAKLTIYDSEITNIDTGKGNDNIKIYNSSVENLSTDKGTDSITIDNSLVGNINSGSGNDYISVSDSTVSNVNTSSNFLFGILDDGEDTVILNDSEIEEVKTGRGSDNVLSENSSVNTLDAGSGSNSLSIEETDIKNVKTNKNDTVIENKNYIDIDKDVILGIESESEIILEDGTSINVNDYANYILSQEVGFETEEEYQEYVLESMSANLESIKSTFNTQEESDGVVSDGYNLLKELTGLGITNEDVESLIAEQEAMIDGLTSAMNGESNMTFEEAYEYYTGTTYSQEKIDKYMEVSQIYSAVMVGCQYDENYIDKFEEATGKSIEDISKEYALCQMETFGRSTGIQDLVEKYSDDQNSFADKLSFAISAVGITCIVAGAVVSFVFPPAAPAGMALMSAGKYISLSGMFVDNAMDLVDDSTDSDGLTKEEIGDLALETGVEAVSYMAGRTIGKLTNGINSVVSTKASDAGIGKVGSYIVGQSAETTADAALSLGADFTIAQAQSLITTGNFMSVDDYWSMDRLLGEGKNQLIGILTGLASSKVNAYQQGVISTAQGKILSGDIEGARDYLRSTGMKMTDTDFDGFVEQVRTVDTEVKTAANTPKINGSSDILVSKFNNVEDAKIYLSSIRTEEAKTVLNSLEKLKPDEINLDRLNIAIDILNGGETITQLKSYAKEISREYSSGSYTIDTILEIYDALGIKPDGEIVQDKNGIYHSKAEGFGTLTGRAKGTDSVYSKLKNKMLKLGSDMPTSTQEAKTLIGDAQGTRLVLNSTDTISKDVFEASEIIKTDIPEKSERVLFTRYLSGETDGISKELLSKFELLRDKGIQELSAIQTQKFVNGLSKAIESGEIKITEVHNYYGKDSVPYLSEQQITKIENAYNKWYQEMLKTADTPQSNYKLIHETRKDGSEIEYLYDVESGNKFYQSLIIETKEKESGYTAAQFNLVNQYNQLEELQFRGAKLDELAEIEHIVYDIKSNKDTVSGVEYDDVRQVINKLESLKKKRADGKTAMDEYNEYFSSVFKSSRLSEVGVKTEQPNIYKDYPLLKEFFTKEELYQISKEGLEELHQQIAKSKENE